MVIFMRPRLCARHYAKGPEYEGKTLALPLRHLKPSKGDFIVLAAPITIPYIY